MHLDLKPANVLLDKNFVAKLGDVGLARFMVGMDQGKSFIQQSMAVGTFGYVDPHFLRTGQFSRESDVYSLGMVLLDMLVGIGEGERGKADKELEALEQCVDDNDEEGLLDLLDPLAGQGPLLPRHPYPALLLVCCRPPSCLLHVLALARESPSGQRTGVWAWQGKPGQRQV